MIHENPLNVLCARLYEHIKNYGLLLPSLVILLVLLPTISAALDSDGDGHDDAQDNCIEIANSDQRDSNGDGFGNVCDADLDNNGMVSFGDLTLFRAAFDTNDADADLDGSGLVSFDDLTIFRALFDRPPGPASDGGGGGDLTRADVARFLTQTTFGPTSGDIDHVISLGGYEAWIDDQLAAAPTLLTPRTQAIYQARHEYCIARSSSCPPSLAEVTTAGADNLFDYESIQHHFAWWDNAIDADDQLRQRVAFALSQIMVVSNRPIELQRSQFAMADYYDTLTGNAFGNFRDLLKDVSLHAVMGIYLGHVKNEKADPDRNIRPDENYAREILQLFSIGLHKLNLDGTPIPGSDGKPEPTYGQFEVQEFARVFTGWNFAGVTWQRDHAGADNTLPMEAHEEYHDTDAKTLLDGEPIAAGLTAQQDLDAAMDNIFNHPNVGPFIGKLLIQRLVTSNPTPAYVSRVASVFNDNGQGTRGDMAAVVKAIFMDTEARNGYTNSDFGKLREPLLRITHLLRTFDASQTDNAYWDWIVSPGMSVYATGFSQTSLDRRAGQRILRSPSVFNFYQPNYSPPGVVRDAGLVAPEFQIVTENSNMAMTNILNTIIFRNVHPRWSTLNLDHEISLVAADPDTLLEHLNVMLMSGGMSNELRTIIRNHLDDASFDVARFTEEEQLRTRVRSAISLIVNSPEYLIQK